MSCECDEVVIVNNESAPGDVSFSMNFLEAESMMSMLCLLQIVDRISRFAAEMPLMLSCRIRMAGPMSRKTWSGPWWLISVPGSVSEFCERFGTLVSPGRARVLTRDATRTLIHYPPGTH